MSSIGVGNPVVNELDWGLGFSHAEAVNKFILLCLLYAEGATSVPGACKVLYLRLISLCLTQPCCHRENTNLFSKRAFLGPTLSCAVQLTLNVGFSCTCTVL